MNGQQIVSNSIFGKISSDATTPDGRNIGQMQVELVQLLDGVFGKLETAKSQMRELEALVAVDNVIRQALRRKIWGGNEITVVVERNGRPAHLGINANDIVDLAQKAVRAIYA